MGVNPNKLSLFWQELKRRKVIRVVVAYIVIGFGIIEFIDIVSEPLNLPDWALTFVIILVAVGLPFIAIFSWIFDITANGISKTRPAKGVDIEAGNLVGTEMEIENENSIAVLPFQDMSAQKDQEYFCDGITEEIINALTRIKNLFVVARTSSFSFKGKNIDVRDIGKKLGVASILEGSVRKSGNKLRITVQLINISDGYHLWSEQFDRELKEIFEIQSEISNQIVNKLQINLLPEEKVSLIPVQTSDIETYSLYLNGRYYWNKLTEEGIKKGMGYFKQAVKNDPRYAPAYSGIADCYSRLGWYSYLPSTDVFPKAYEAALRALDLDPNLSEAYTSKAFFSMCFERDYKKAENDFRKAIQINPNSAQAYANYSILLSITGKHDEAIFEGEKALMLDPLTMMMHINLGMRYFYKREFNKSLDHINKTFEMDPGFVVAHYYRTYVNIQTKNYQSAKADIQQVFTHTGRKIPAFLIAYAIVLALSPDDEELTSVIDEIHELSKQRYIPPFWLSMLYFVLKNYDEGYKWLNKAYLEHDCLLIFLNVDPLFDSVRNDPEYRTMLRKIDLI
jgi:TolB-like protein/Tfp pilus assembly protein PilF